MQPGAHCARGRPTFTTPVPRAHIMDDAPGMDRVARITLSLGGFMLVLLISVPFTFETESSSYFASYVIYSLFLASVGVIIGVSLMWLNDPTRVLRPIQEESFRRPMLSEDQASIVTILMANNSTMWQADLVKKLGFTDSKASRLLSRMEADGHIRRIRDGMGKRIELTEDIK
jgi:hypothetical protein